MDAVRSYLAYRADDGPQQIVDARLGVDFVLDRLVQNTTELTSEQEVVLAVVSAKIAAFTKLKIEFVALHSGDAWRRDAELMPTQIIPNLRAIKTQLASLVARQTSANKVAAQSLLTGIGSEREFASMVGSIGAGFAALMLLFTAATTTSRLNRIAAVARLIAAGDFTAKLMHSTPDEVGHVI